MMAMAVIDGATVPFNQPNASGLNLMLARMGRGTGW